MKFGVFRVDGASRDTLASIDIPFDEAQAESVHNDDFLEEVAHIKHTLQTAFARIWGVDGSVVRVFSESPFDDDFNPEGATVFSLRHDADVRNTICGKSAEVIMAVEGPIDDIKSALTDAFYVLWCLPRVSVWSSDKPVAKDDPDESRGPGR